MVCFRKARPSPANAVGGASGSQPQIQEEKKKAKGGRKWHTQCACRKSDGGVSRGVNAASEEERECYGVKEDGAGSRQERPPPYRERAAVRPTQPNARHETAMPSARYISGWRNALFCCSCPPPVVTLKRHVHP